MLNRIPFISPVLPFVSRAGRAAGFLMVLAMVAGCAPQKSTAPASGQFWRSTDTQSALYLRGPKAQSRLHNDIGGCVAKVRELVRLGAIREGTPPRRADLERQDRDPFASSFDTPSHSGAMRIEVRAYNNFETCMRQQGWEPVHYVNGPTLEEARANFIETVFGSGALQEFRLRDQDISGARRGPARDGDFQELND